MLKKGTNFDSMVKKDLSENPDDVWHFMCTSSLALILRSYQSLWNFNLIHGHICSRFFKDHFGSGMENYASEGVTEAGSLFRKYSSVAQVRLHGGSDEGCINYPLLWHKLL